MSRMDFNELSHHFGWNHFRAADFPIKFTERKIDLRGNEQREEEVDQDQVHIDIRLKSQGPRVAHLQILLLYLS